MDGRPIPLVLKLRRNIALEGDLVLARLELEALTPAGLRPVRCLSELARDHPPLGGWQGLCGLGAWVRPEGVQGYLTEAPLGLLPELIRRLSFVQAVYGIAPDGPGWPAWLAKVKGGVGPVVADRIEGDLVTFVALPHYALFELAEVMARTAAGPDEVDLRLGALLEALLGRSEAPRAQRWAEQALAAQTTTSPLSHGLHYYKAKFFPRLARSMINVAERMVGDGDHRLLDPFVGSGTALVESAALGIPSLGLDLDPLPVLISRAKLALPTIEAGLLAAGADRVGSILQGEADGGAGAIRAAVVEPVAFPAWLTRNRKMTAPLAAQLSQEIRLLQQAVAAGAPEVQPLLRVLMSDAIARRVRLRFLGTGVGRFSLTLAKSTAPQVMARSLRRLANVAAALGWFRRTLGLRFAPAEAVQGDARRLPDSLGTFDLVLTSPPYLPASSGRESYARARALSLIALGITDPLAVDDLAGRMIGAMEVEDVDWAALTPGERDLVAWLQDDPLRSIKARPTARYFADLRQAFGQLWSSLRPGAVAVVVSGRQSTFYHFASRQALYVAPSAELLAEEAVGAGFVVAAMHDLQLVKLNPNARPRSLDDYYETLILLRRPNRV